MTQEQIDHVMALLEEGYTEQDIAEIMSHSLQWVHSSVILDRMNRNNIIRYKEQKTGIKNELTGKYMTRAEALIYHLMLLDATLNDGFYLDAVHYQDHIFNDMLILECAAKPEV